MPVASSWRASAAGSGSPARQTVRTAAGSPCWRSSSPSTEGTVLISVTRAAAGRRASEKAFSARITVPPQHSGASSSNTERSKQIEVEARTPASSAGENAARAQCASTAALRWVMATALGRPVDPEV